MSAALRTTTALPSPPRRTARSLWAGNSTVAPPLESDARIVVAGWSWNGFNSDFAVVRYNADGSLDTSFSGDGKATTAVGSGTDEGRPVALQPDGKIVVAGYSWNGSNYDVAAGRYNTDGRLG